MEILEIHRVENTTRTNNFDSRLQELFKIQDEINISQVKKTGLRLHCLDDSFTLAEMAVAMPTTGCCDPSRVNLGEKSHRSKTNMGTV